MSTSEGTGWGGTGAGGAPHRRRLDPVEARVVGATDPEAAVSFLTELVSVRSLAGAERPAQEAVAAGMEQMGLRTDVWEIDFRELRRHPVYSADVEREDGLGVVGSTGGGEGPTLIMNAHVDVVPPGDPARWSHPPWRATRADGRVYGRGTADTKGGLAAALFAARALRDAGVELDGTLQIQSVIGEEDGGVGTLATLLRGHTGDAAVVLEPTRLAVAPSQAGALNFRIVVPGIAAHGALREEGVDPVEKFIHLFHHLRELEARRNRELRDPLYADHELPFALTMGKLRAGEWASNVPESLVCEGRLGVAPSEAPAGARRAFEETVANAASENGWLREHPPVVEWWGAQFAPARIPADHRLVGTLTTALRDVSGEEPEVRGMTYGADMRLLVNQGNVPSVIFGPGDIRDAHRPDESVAVSELALATRTLALAALRFCGHRATP